MAAMHMLRCNMHVKVLCKVWEDEQEPESMAFLTELISRPRPQEQARYRAALAILNAMSNADRADIGIKPADFPRIAREMSMR